MAGNSVAFYVFERIFHLSTVPDLPVRRFHQKALQSVPLFLGAFLVSLPPSTVLANPTGEQVAGGSATFDRSGNNLNITTSDRAIINWADFSIQVGETTKFFQPNSMSATLNRVTSSNPSSLLGSLQANGQLYLINPNGILVGPGANINTANFVGSTLDIQNSEFMLGQDLHFMGNSLSGIENQGTINAIGGNVFLMAHHIQNSGNINAANGTVGLGAGTEFLLKQSGNDLTMVQMATPTASGTPNGTGILNQGVIQAAQAELKANGNIYQFAINNTGIIRANGSVQKDGRVYLTSAGGTIKNSGLLAAKNFNGSGGKVFVQATHSDLSPSTVYHSGNIDVSSVGTGLTAGEVRVLGDQVALIDQSKIDARGDAGGGTVLIGGDYQGKNAAIQNAQKTYVSKDSLILADALLDGDGGKVIVWADGLTRYYGSIFARGGSLRGNGGFAETSGKQTLDFNGHADLSAAYGKFGKILLDPSDIDIVSSAGGQTFDAFVGTADGLIMFADSGTTAGTLSDTALLGISASTDVDIEAQHNLTIDTGLSFSQSSGRTVVFRAGNNLLVNNTVSTLGAALVFSADDNGGSTASGTGEIYIDANIGGANTGAITFDLHGNSATGNIYIGSGSSLIQSLSTIHFNGNVSFSSASPTLVIQTSSSAVDFTGTVNGPRDLSFNIGTGTLTFNGAVGNLTAIGDGIGLAFGKSGGGGLTWFKGGLTTSSGISITGPSQFDAAVTLGNGDTGTSIGSSTTLSGINFSGFDGITFSGPVNLTAFGSTINGNGGNVTFSSTINGAQTLTVNTTGTTTFNGIIGGTTPLAQLITDASGTTAINTTAINTSGLQTFNDALTLGADVFLTSSSGGNISVLSGLTGNNHSLTLQTTGVNLLKNNLTGITTLTSNAGGNTTVFGDITTSGDQIFNDALTLSTDVILTSSSSGNIFLNAGVQNGNSHNLTINTAGTTKIMGANSGTSLSSLTTDASGTTQLSGTFNSLFNFIANDPVTLIANTTVHSTSGGITFGSTVDGGFNLIANASGGATTFGGAVGNSTALTSLTTDSGGGTTINGGSINTTTALAIADALTLGGNTTLSSGGITLTGGATGAGNSLTLNSSGVTSLTGTYGGFSTFTTDVAGSTTLNGTITSTGNQTFNDAVNLAGNTTINAGAGNITFGSTIDQGQTLTLNSSGTTTLVGAVGGSAALAALTSDSAGTSVFNGGTINATGNIRFDDGLTIGLDTTMTSASGGITLGTGATGTAHSLTLNSSGLTALSGVFTGLTTLTTDSGGTTQLSGSITTSGGQTFDDSIILNFDTTLASTSNGQIQFNAINGNARSLTVNTGGVTKFLGSATGFSSLTTDASGSTTMGGGTISSTGNQVFNDAVTLTANTTVSSSAGGITFGSTVDGSFSLTANVPTGSTAFIGAVGSGNALTSLTTDAGGGTITATPTISTGTGGITFNDTLTLTGDITLNTSTGPAFLTGVVGNSHSLTINSFGTTTLNGSFSGIQNLLSDPNGFLSVGGTFTTVNATFNDPLTLIANTTINANGASGITFGSTIDGGFSLTANIATAPTTFNGAVGGTTALTSLTTDTGGGTVLNGGLIRTSGVQTYNDFVTLNADTTFTSTGTGDILFGNSINGARNLIVNTAGITKFGGIVGGTTQLTSITTDAPGKTEIGSSITTTGNQDYKDQVELFANVPLNGNNLIFENTVDSQTVSRNLTLTANNVDFQGTVGGVLPLANLTVNQVGNFTIKNDILANGTLSITTTGGSIIHNNTFGSFSHVLYGNGITLSAASGSIGGTATDPVYTSANSLIMNALGDIVVTDYDDVILGNISSSSGDIFINGAYGVAGDMTLSGFITGGSAAKTINLGTITGGSILQPGGFINAAGTSFFSSAVGMINLTQNNLLTGTIGLGGSFSGTPNPVFIKNTLNTLLGNISLNQTYSDLTIDSNGMITEGTGALDKILAHSLTLSSGGAISLMGPNQTANHVTILGNVTRGGNFAFQNNGDLTINGLLAGTINNNVDIYLTGAADTLTLAPGASILSSGAGNGITLATQGKFLNGAGSSVLSAASGARYFVYSHDPAQNVLGGIVPDFEEFFVNYTTLPLNLVPATHASGNVFLYVVGPPPPPPIVVPVTTTTVTTFNNNTTQIQQPILTYAALTPPPPGSTPITYTDAGSSAIMPPPPGSSTTTMISGTQTTTSSGSTTALGTTTDSQQPPPPPPGDGTTQPTTQDSNDTHTNRSGGGDGTNPGGGGNDSGTENPNNKDGEKNADKNDDKAEKKDQTASQSSASNSNSKKDDHVLPAGAAMVMGGGNMPITATPPVLQKAISIEVRNELANFLK